jgi:putative transposase
VWQAVQKQAKSAALAAVQSVLEAFLEAEVTAKLGREKGEARRMSSQTRVIDWTCAHGGCSDGKQFTRDGHDRRGLSTGWGYLSDLHVPMVECQQCQHDVVCHVAILEKYARFWMDVDQELLSSSGLGMSLRQLQERWSATMEGSIGLRTRNERINQIERRASVAHMAPLSDIPPVIQLDGIWVTIQSQQEKIKPDTRQRQRHQRSGTKMVVLVALGFWEDGRREVLDWQIAGSEDHQEWEVLVHRLWERGCQPERGLQLVVRDGSGGLGEALALVSGATICEHRCIFHKLHHVSTKVRSELKGKERQEERKQLMQQAAAMYQAGNADEARHRLSQWRTTWQDHAPQAVATLERDFEQTLVFYAFSGLALAWIRTTSLFERTNRELRRKFRLSVTLGSVKGADVAVFLHVRRLHARWVSKTWWETSQEVFFDLWKAYP